MALDSYVNLRAAIAGLLDRTDLAGQIPDWITLAEADLKRELQRTEARGQYTINATTWTLPAVIGELLSIRLVTGSASLDRPLSIVTSYDGDTHRARRANTAGRPQQAYIIGRKVVFTPSPDTSYTVEVTYVEALTPLSDSVSSNAVLEEAPDVYLYGAAIHSAPFLGDDSRLELWAAFYRNALEGLNRKRDREKWGANPKRATPSTTFG